MTDDFRNDQERTGTMITQSGVRFDFRNPRPEDIRVHDVGHALGHYCRYGGHVPHHYSVAEHSVHVAVWVLALGGTLDDAKWGLTHDTEETWFGDVIGPLKQLPEMSGYKELTKRFVRQALVPKFGLVPDSEPELVKRVDTAMLEVELAVLRNIVNDKVQHDAYHKLMPFQTGYLPIPSRDPVSRARARIPVTYFHLVRVDESGVTVIGQKVVLYGHHRSWERPVAVDPDDEISRGPLFGMNAHQAKRTWLRLARSFGIHDEGSRGSLR